MANESDGKHANHDVKPGAQEPADDVPPAECSSGQSFRRKLRDFLSVIAASSIVLFRTRPKPETPAEPGGKKQGSFGIGLIFTGLLPLLAALAGVYLYSSQSIANLRADIIIDPIAIPQKVMALGVANPDQLLVRAIGLVDEKLGEYQVQFSEGDRRMARVPMPINAGQERFCPQTNISDLVRLDAAYFDVENRRQITPLGDLEQDRFQLPGIEAASNLIRRWMGWDVVRLQLEVHQTGDRFELLTYVIPVSGQDGAPTPKKFVTPLIHVPSGVAGGRSLEQFIELAITEGIMRVAYPEATALALGAVGRTDLDVEEHVAKIHPSEDRRQAVQFGHLKALLSRNNRLTMFYDWRRAQFLLQELNAAPEARYFTLSDEEAGLIETRLSALVVGNGQLTEPFVGEFVRREANWLEKLATAKGKNFSDILDNADPVRRFDLVELRVANHLYASRNFYSSDFSALAAYNAWLLEMIDLAERADTVAEDDIRAGLHDAILLYAAILNERVMATARVMETIPAEAETLLADFAAFHDSRLAAIDERWSLFDDNERDLLESVAIGAQLWAGETHDALARAARIGRDASPCIAVALSAQVYDPNMIRLQSKAHDDPAAVEPLRKQAFDLLKHAEADGLRQFALFNAIGTIAGDLGRHDEALAAFAMAAQHTGERPWAYLNKGRHQLLKGDAPAAEVSYSQSLDTNLEDCKRDMETWRDIDTRHNEARRQMVELAAQGVDEIAKQQALAYYLINRECTRQGSGIPNAFFGLLDSLAAQEKSGEYLRAYETYASSDIWANAFPDPYRAMLTTMRKWTCTGTLKTMPKIPANLADEFPTENGAFVCQAEDG